MPEMLGIDLLRAAQRIDAAIVSVVMTGEGSVARAVEAMQAGALDFIMKPFTLRRSCRYSRAHWRCGVCAWRTGSSSSACASTLPNSKPRTRNSPAANKALAAANDELAVFNHSISHDLRAVDGLSELLLNNLSAHLPVEAQRFMATMNLSVKRMKQLVNDLLRFLNLGQQALHPRILDMSALVRSALNDLHHEPQSGEVEVRIGPLLRTEGDSALLRAGAGQPLVECLQVHAPPGAPRHRARARTEADGTPTYFVRDNGAGFDMARAQRLFGVFQRLHRNDEFEGNGVGLSIVRRIVDRHLGRNWAEAAVGARRDLLFHVEFGLTVSDLYRGIVRSDEPRVKPLPDRAAKV